MRSRFVRTETVLDKILDHKVMEIETRRAAIPVPRVVEAATLAAPPRDMLAALRGDESETVVLIAEVKHASPSRGVLVEPFQPVSLGKTYARHGAAAISVLTDERFFMGSLDDMTAVRNAVDVPVLRKDFVIDPYQVYEGRAAGADAILLIVAGLEDGQLADLHALVTGLGMAALVEVHDEAELDRALRLDPALIGINNRDLKTFDVRLETTVRLAPRVPETVTLVAESGIRSAGDVRQMGAAGAHAVLVGETLVQARQPGHMVRQLSGQRRKEAL